MPRAPQVGRYFWASITALGINYLLVPAFRYPMGGKSYYSLEGTDFRKATKMFVEMKKRHGGEVIHVA